MGIFKRAPKASKRTGRRGRKMTPAQADKAVKAALKAEGIKGTPDPAALKKIQAKIARQNRGGNGRDDDGDHFRDA